MLIATQLNIFRNGSFLMGLMVVLSFNNFGRGASSQNYKR